ncbi:acyl-CoA dehydrogenase family protein [Streptomyces rubiginosohelvolus]|uniref:acyl-CoA dehydrogenase family protein n=1 Tax=Streptomyces rubiginosohelvolus TaxID=67362 RepID=UPI00378847B7
MIDRNDLQDAVDRVLPVLVEEARSVDAEARFPEAGLKALRDSGLLGLLVPRDHGGLGGHVGDLVAVAQELASGCLSTAMIWAMHCQQSDALVRFASPGLGADLLPRIARGQLYLGSVTTEPGKGGHLLTGGAPLQRASDTLLLEREAPVVTGGGHADGFLITMRAAPDAAESEVTLVYADRDQLDLVPRKAWDTLGMRGTQSGGLFLSGALPITQIVGDVGDFRRIATESMAPVGHLAWSACWLGTARAALTGLVTQVRSPNRPRGIDPRSDLSLERLARIRMDLELAGGYLHRVQEEVLARRSEGASLEGPALQIHLNTLKVAVSELTHRSVDRMVQLAGLGLGYSRDAPLHLERDLRDLRSAALNYANDRLLTSIGALTLMDRGVNLA